MLLLINLEREAYTFPITLVNVTGTFSEGEDFTSGGASGTVVSFDSGTGKLTVVYPKGAFQEGETVTGPNGTGEIQSFTTIQIESLFSMTITLLSSSKQMMSLTSLNVTRLAKSEISQDSF